MPSKKAQQVLRDIFGDFGREPRPNPGWAVLHASYDDVVAFAELLAKNAVEQDFQKLLTQAPQLLVGGLGGNYGHQLAFLTKPPIGTQYRADFAMLSYSQGGGALRLIEIERANDPLFTRAGTPARRLQSALGQVHAWDVWIKQNHATFVRDIVDHCREIPVYPGRSKNGSFLHYAFPSLQSRWERFGGFDAYPVTYTICIGRWSRLSETHRRKLLHMNRFENLFVNIYTFEQLARHAYVEQLAGMY